MAYNSLSTANLPDPGVDPNAGKEPRDYFETFLYTGNGGGLQVGDVIKKPADTTTISNSLIFNRTGSHSTSARLTRTFAAGDRRTWTWSGWVKRSSIASYHKLFAQKGNGANDLAIVFNTDDGVRFVESDINWELLTSRKFKDTGVWHHVLVSLDTTQATASDRAKIYVDGVLQSLSTANYPTQNAQYDLNNSGVHHIGSGESASSTTTDSWFDGYMAEIHFVDGAVHGPTDFGSFDANGYWIPKVVTGITYGTNGFYLDFSDNTSTTTLGEDQTANGNDWTLDNMATTDQVTDSPTDNCPILWAERSTTSVTLSEGNRRMNLGSYDRSARTHRLPTSGKYYWELDIDLAGSGSNVGLHDYTLPVGNPAAASPNHTNSFRYNSNGNVLKDTTAVFSGTAYSSGAIAMFAVDFDAGLLWVGKDGTWFNSGDPANGTGYVSTLHPNVQYGINSVSSSADTTVILYTGQEAYTHTKPTGFASLTENNITVDDQNLESPDFVWIKNRDQADAHHLYDSLRSVQKALYSSATTAETDEPNGLLDFNKNGFTIGSEVEVNTSGEDYVAWNWKAGGTAVSNTDGSITSTVSANTTSGFSIVTYTGNGTTNATIGHGLSQAPEVVIQKNTGTASTQWRIDHFPSNVELYFDTGANQSDYWNNSVSSSVITLNKSDSTYQNYNNNTYVAYCFHSVDGFSKFGSYIGNGSTDGTFVYTGFRPAWVMIRTTGSSAWYMADNKRDTYNVADELLQADSNAATFAYTTLDMTSNGFKLRNTGTGVNGSGSTYIYMAFAETPFKYATAR